MGVCLAGGYRLIEFALFHSESANERKRNINKQDLTPQTVGQYLEEFPVYPINFSDSTEKARHDEMVGLVNRMLSLNTQLPTAKIAHEKTILQRQIDATDRQINRLVYELYGLTGKEIKFIEEQIK